MIHYNKKVFPGWTQVASGLDQFPLPALLELEKRLVRRDKNIQYNSRAITSRDTKNKRRY